MTYRFVTIEELNVILKVPFNPPSIHSEDERRHFHDEYVASHVRVKHALEVLGVHDAFGDGDFNMNEDWFCSRGISVELCSEELLRPELIPTIQAALKALPERYSVYVDTGTFDCESFYLLIERDQVTITCSDSIMLKRLGLIDAR